MKTGGLVAWQQIPSNRTQRLIAEYKCNRKDAERYTDEIKQEMVLALAKKMYENNLLDIEKVILQTGGAVYRIRIDIIRRYDCIHYTHVPIVIDPKP